MITCNGAEFVEEQLRSVLEQTRPPDELVVSDDASTDDTVERLTKLTHGAPLRVRVLRNPQRLGVSANLQQAVKAASGDVVLFADQDDIWKPERIARIASEFAAHPDVDLVFSNAELVDRSGRALPDSLWERVRFGQAEQVALTGDDAAALGVILRHNVVTGATIGVRRSLLDAALPFPMVGWHDHWLALYAAATGVGIRAVADRLLAYRLHGANAAGLPSRSPVEWRREQSTAWSRREAIVGMLDELLERLPEARADVRERVELARTFLRHRQQLSRNPLRRFRAVSRWSGAGGYVQFADGFRSVSLDLLLPQRPRNQQ